MQIAPTNFEENVSKKSVCCILFIVLEVLGGSVPIKRTEASQRASRSVLQLRLP